MSPLKITEGILNKKNEINSLNNSCNDNDSSQNYRRNLNKKNEINSLNNSSNDNVSSQNHRRNLKQKEWDQ